MGFLPFEQENEKPSFIKMLDIPNFVGAVIAAVLWVISKFCVPQFKLYVPPNDSLSNFPKKVGKDLVPFNPMITGIIISQFLLVFLVYFLSKKFPKILKEFNPFTAFYIGIIIFSFNNFATNIIKGYVGRARPDLYGHCGENSNHLTCNKKEEFRSWPSGHSSASMSGTLYPCLFLQKVVKTRNSIWIIVCCMLPIISLYVGGSRIRDFRHHPDDVLAGLFLGAFITFIFWIRTYKTIFLKKINDISNSQFEA